MVCVRASKVYCTYLASCIYCLFSPNSLKVVKAYAARSVVERASAWEKDPWDCAFQFERVGYFCKDPDSTKEHLGAFKRLSFISRLRAIVILTTCSR